MDVKSTFLLERRYVWTNLYVKQGHDEKVYKVKALYDLKQLIHQGHGHTPDSLNVLMSIHCM